MVWSRREVLEVLAQIGASSLFFGCLEGEVVTPPQAHPPVPEYPEPIDPAEFSSNLRALIDVLLPGALEAGAERVLRIDDFLVLAEAQGLVPPLPDGFLVDRAGFDLALQRTLDADLDALAFAQRPLTSFRLLPRALQEAAVSEGFEAPAQRPLLQFVRAASFIGYLGAVTSDQGLVAIGYPTFEDFAGGIAVSGYPRTRSGRLIDAATEDLAALALAGDLDDYSYNQDPEPTLGDDLSLVVDLGGDLF